MLRTLCSLVVLALLGAGCTTPPAERTPVTTHSEARAAAPQGPLADVEAELRERHGVSASGFMLLDANEAGLRWRLAIIDAARDSLDLQYYMWLGDNSGKLLLDRVLAAAGRGVRVRIIVDDLSTMLEDETHLLVRDDIAAAIDAHPNIELRLFNAWHARSLLGRALESIEQAARVNYRMHNKLMVVDNRVAIIGGRNIGDHYFGLSTTFNFRDLDVFGVGPVARQASGVFDRFWNSSWVASVAELGIGATPGAVEALSAALARQADANEFFERFSARNVAQGTVLPELGARLHAGTSRVFTDSPDEGAVTHHMPAAIRGLLATAREEVLITNAYVIPGQHALERMRAQVAAGVRCRLLTNSLASHDVPAVNSHYKQWRPRLIDAGVEVYEVRPDAAVQAVLADTAPVRSSFMGLHAKAMVIDKQRVFIGSLNLDPRSWQINSEMGVVIESPTLAQELGAVMDRDMRAENAWRVVRSADGDLQWVGGGETRSSQPARDFWQRIEDMVFMAFPADLY